MDYKYIEQLLEKYWNCETSLEEEQILRTFFRQEDVPAHLLRFKPLFAFQEEERQVGLGKDFDERILAEIERPRVKAKRLTLRSRIMPLFKAAAVMILLFTVGGIVKHSMGTGESGVVYVYDQYKNKTHDPQVAYETDSLKSLLKVKERERSAFEKE